MNPHPWPGIHLLGALSLAVCVLSGLILGRGVATVSAELPGLVEPARR
jgi:hypothetical protein